MFDLIYFFILSIMLIVFLRDFIDGGHLKQLRLLRAQIEALDLKLLISLHHMALLLFSRRERQLLEKKQ